VRGTIQKKGKKWYAVVYDGVNPEDRQVPAPVGPSRHSAW
jgi:hypothetical protein